MSLPGRSEIPWTRQGYIDVTALELTRPPPVLSTTGLAPSLRLVLIHHSLSRFWGSPLPALPCRCLRTILCETVGAVFAYRGIAFPRMQ